MASDARVIRAAGGVVWRHQSGGLEVALVHRPKYDDWSLPKGKLEAGESALAAAVREIREELGAEVAVSRRLDRIDYDVPDGHKRVDFWVMRHRGGTFAPTAEIDEVRWLPVGQARAELSHAGERRVLADLARLPVPESVLVLIRHAKAGKRAHWHADDNDRPLDDEGRRQAERLSSFLQAFAPDRVMAAAPLRCVQTVQPLARDLALELAVDATFSDDAFLRNPETTIAAVHALAKPGRVSVLCSQGETIPGLIEHFAPSVQNTRTKKAAAWVLGFVDGTVASADYYPHAAAEPVTAS